MCEALRELFADDLRESREEGVLEGRNAGKIEGKIEQVIKKYQKGCTVDEAADMLEESPNLIRQIYDVIQHGTVNLDAEQIYKVLLENSCLEIQK